MFLLCMFFVHFSFCLAFIAFIYFSLCFACFFRRCSLHDIHYSGTIFYIELSIQLVYLQFMLFFHIACKFDWISVCIFRFILLLFYLSSTNICYTLNEITVKLANLFIDLFTLNFYFISFFFFVILSIAYTPKLVEEKKKFMKY